MDGLFGHYDALDEEAASGLLTLSELNGASQDTVKTPPLSRTASDAGNPTGDTTSPTLDPVSSADTTPVREFKLAGMKRERDDTYTIIYSSGEDIIGVPYTKGDGVATLFERRDEAARRLFDANRDTNRGDAYCSWRSTMISLIIKDTRWTKFKASFAQERYNYKAIQLVITRYTCTQWRDISNLCRNCENRNWRTACIKPKFVMHVLPLPVYRSETKLCEQCLSELEAVDISVENKSDWVTRMPQMNVR
jgi:hypothetical protein